MAHDVFISHSTSNRPVANAVCAALENAGIRCWIAPRDVMPGRSYSGEITRAIQQSRAFVLIFSLHSNNSEQVLREVQLAANSRLHIVQFRIDAVSPSDDLEYYLSGPHWLDAVTPPLEGHLEQLKSSMLALLSLPRAEGPDQPAPARPITPAAPPSPPGQNYTAAAPAAPVAAAQPSIHLWKLAALIVAAVAVLGCVVLVLLFTLLRPQPTPAPGPSSTPAAAPQTAASLQPKVPTEPAAAPSLSTAAPLTTVRMTAADAEAFAKQFYRDMERGDLNSIASYLDETVDYFSLGPKDKAFIGEQTRQFLAALPKRSFTVNDVKVQDSGNPKIATVLFDVRYSAQDVFGNRSAGHTKVEWDVIQRSDGLKIVRSNWMTYPDASPSR